MRSDRRRTARRVPEAQDALARVRLRGGRELIVVDVSPGGAMVEGTARLLPGTHVDVHVTTRDGRVLARARVIRAFVCRVEPESIHYRAGLAFETAVDTTAHGYLVPVGSRTDARYPSTSAQHPFEPSISTDKPP
jgi:hypothetical protein